MERRVESHQISGDLAAERIATESGRRARDRRNAGGESHPRCVTLKDAVFKHAELKAELQGGPLTKSERPRLSSYAVSEARQAHHAACDAADVPGLDAGTRNTSRSSRLGLQRVFVPRHLARFVVKATRPTCSGSRVCSSFAVRTRAIRR